MTRMVLISKIGNVVKSDICAETITSGRYFTVLSKALNIL